MPSTIEQIFSRVRNQADAVLPTLLEADSSQWNLISEEINQLCAELHRRFLKQRNPSPSPAQPVRDHDNPIAQIICSLRRMFSPLPTQSVDAPINTRQTSNFSLQSGVSPATASSFGIERSHHCAALIETVDRASSKKTPLSNLCDKRQVDAVVEGDKADTTEGNRPDAIEGDRPDAVEGDRPATIEWNIPGAVGVRI
ncbi:hypothetical protein K469DRAFT_791736 [Zopfia rhizophila CBS 207.26]|uniref:Uncharacterized protein n=1 Tax=Zopfia rhizophila CBS 207.26 TaxID=1314779 RepID=A0A6A6DTZ9_9PEZI|nr:hypothetical protein K469DRAFT_791736 [Zopfia rhizophila CBS 207.26]